MPTQGGTGRQGKAAFIERVQTGGNFHFPLIQAGFVNQSGKSMLVVNCLCGKLAGAKRLPGGGGQVAKARWWQRIVPFCLALGVIVGE